MKRNWGDLEDEEVLEQKISKKELRMSVQKKDFAKIIQRNILFPDEKLKILPCKNAAVTQTVEVIHQSSVIENELNNKNHDMLDPNILFKHNPSTAKIRINKKFQKPIWFIPPGSSDFESGKRKKDVPKVTKRFVIAALRKSIAGLINIKKFSEVDESALVMFIDSVDNFYKQFMEEIVATLVNDKREKETRLNIADVEKSYHAFTGNSITSFHNYYNEEIIQKNQTEVSNFLDTVDNYEKIFKSSQNLNNLQVIDTEGFTVKLENDEFDFSMSNN